jgi:deoxyribonuclease-4
VIGAHVSVAGGLDNVLSRARKIRAEAVQIFASSPRQWRPSPYSVEQIHDLGVAMSAAGVPLFLHTIYLINLASPDAALRRRSAEAVAATLRVGAQAAASGVVTHVGSHRGDGFDVAVERVAASLVQTFQGAAVVAGELPPLLLETSAGGSGAVGNSPRELGMLLRRVDAGAALGVCLDTAHLFAAGYPVHTPEGVGAFLDELDDEVGLESVGLVHLNDSACELGTRRDRHANLWTGEIGRSGLEAWLREPRLQQVPFVLEPPGFDGSGPDRRNLWRAKRLRNP